MVPWETTIQSKQTQSLGKSLVAIAKSCANIATDVEKAHEEFKLNECGAGGPFQGRYFRFNVDRGLQDIKLHEWKQMEAAESHTDSYLEVNEEELARCIECLVQCDQVTKKKLSTKKK